MSTEKTALLEDMRALRDEMIQGKVSREGAGQRLCALADTTRGLELTDPAKCADPAGLLRSLADILDDSGDRSKVRLDKLGNILTQVIRMFTLFE